jgi:hypothetical protein
MTNLNKLNSIKKVKKPVYLLKKETLSNKMIKYSTNLQELAFDYILNHDKIDNDCIFNTVLALSNC